MRLNRPAQLAAILGIVAGTIVGVWHLRLPTGVVGEVRVYDEDRADQILAELDRAIADERASHVAPRLGTTLEPKDFRARTTEMVRLDQLVRTWEPEEPIPPELRQKVWNGLWERVKAVDKQHTRELERWVRRNEWPTLSQVGRTGMRNAWLIAQHADHKVAFQKVVLRQLGDRARRGEAERWQYAYLWDRVAVNEKRLQRFATQGRCVARDAWEAWPFERPVLVDKRRAKMGLDTYAEYRARMSANCANLRR
jgi:hypothetical protein